jgi:flagellar hook assembly protein FlgD
MATVDRQKSIKIPDGTTRAMLSIDNTGNKATVRVKNSDGDVIKTFNFHDGHKKEDARLPTAPAGQSYDLYNAGPSGINVTFL